MTTPYDPSLGQTDPSFDPAAQPAPEAPPVPAPTYLSKPTQPAIDPMALLQPVGTISAGSSSSSSRTELGKAGQDALKAKQAADQSTIAAGDKQAASNTERLQAQEQAASEKAAAGAEFDAKLQLKQAAFAKRSEDHYNGITRAADEAEKAATELDPDRFWHSQTTGQRIGNILSIALSGIGNVFQAKAMAHGANLGPIRNGALDLINTAIDRDIDLQKTALAAKQRGVQIRESVYAAARQAGADDIQATVAARAQYLGKVDRDLEVRTAHANSSESRQAGERLRAQVQEQQAAEKQRLAELTATHVQSTVASKPILQGELLAMQGQIQAGQDAAYRKEHGLVEKNANLQTPMGQARDPDAAKSIAQAHVDVAPAERAVEIFEKLGKKKVLSPAEDQLFQSARSAYKTFIHGKYGDVVGRFSDSVMQLVDEQVPNRKAWSMLTGKDNMITKEARDAVNRVKQRVKEGYTVPTE